MSQLIFLRKNKMKKENKLERKTIEVNLPIENYEEIFKELKLGDIVYWETHNGKDKYEGVVIDKSQKYFQAITREYIEENPSTIKMGNLNSYKAIHGNSIRIKDFEVKENKIRYWGEGCGVFFEYDPRGKKERIQYQKFDKILKERGI